LPQDYLEEVILTSSPQQVILSARRENKFDDETEEDYLQLLQSGKIIHKPGVRRIEGHTVTFTDES
jgi:hypothetical protein